MTCQEQPQLLHLSSPGCLPELWPWIWPAESVALPLSSGRHTPATAPAHPDARAQPCVPGELSALISLASASRASLLLVRDLEDDDDGCGRSEFCGSANCSAQFILSHSKYSCSEGSSVLLPVTYRNVRNLYLSI